MRVFENGRKQAVRIPREFQLRAMRLSPIGGNDLLIAGHALALGSTLVTDNEPQFARLERLKIENWLR